MWSTRCAAQAVKDIMFLSSRNAELERQLLALHVSPLPPLVSEARTTEF